MKIHSITVKNVRGLVDFTFEPKGKSVVVFGPNGSGKSALVDSIDFLFTGKIQRLEGEGTGEVSLRDHGPHFGHAPAEAVVSAVVILPDGRKFTLERAMSSAKTLKCNPPADADMIAALEISSRGYHVLSRREILRYIAAEPAERAKSIQALMNVSEIEDLRKLLNGVKNEMEASETATIRSGSISQADIVGLLGLAQFDNGLVLSAVNAQRAILKAPLIGAESLGSPKMGVAAPASGAAQPGSPVVVADDVKRISLSEDARIVLKAAEKNLKALLTEIEKDPTLRADLDSKELVDLGLSLLGDGANCPLCEKPWETGHLRKFLEEKQQKAEKAAEMKQKATALSDEIIRVAGVLETVLPRLVAACERLGLADSKNFLSDTVTRWTIWRKRLSNTLLEYPSNAEETIETEFFGNEVFSKHLVDIQAVATAAVPVVSPEQVSWDVLTKFESQWQSSERFKKDIQNLASKKDQASALAQTFQKSRDAVMAGLYTSIEASFKKYYCILHDHEKSTFEAALRPDGAALRFEVDFQGKGKFPPIAFHSEGHQDSMGLCLYLALMEKLTQGKVGFTILDDVVMSVDSGHRQPVCELFSSGFSERQFFITTHDKIWARQIRNAGVVQQSNFLAFRAWTVEKGPKWREEDQWLQIGELLKEDRIPMAAAALRRELEEFFDDTCDLLVARVPYSGDGRYELFDLMESAIGRFGRLLKDAKKSAVSWNQLDKLKELNDWESRFDAAKKTGPVEAVIINPTVHFNRLIQTSAQDFAPVFLAFTQLRDCFRCPSCQSLLFISPRKPQGEMKGEVRCRCGSIHWNLLEKTKDDEKRLGIAGVEVVAQTSR